MIRISAGDGSLTSRLHFLGQIRLTFQTVGTEWWRGGPRATEAAQDGHSRASGHHATDFCHCADPGEISAHSWGTCTEDGQSPWGKTLQYLRIDTWIVKNPCEKSCTRLYVAGVNSLDPPIRAKCRPL